MIRITRLAVPVAALLLAACGGDAEETPAANPDSVSAAAAASAVPGALGNAPERAQVGVDSSNAAVDRRSADVEALSNEASGAGTATTTP
ncbi:MAG TPA: hypothetical protein VFS20_25140 [Longimicrobium sp.]|nr:hypothetical protein [Longimicrobium sp.]